MDPMLQTPNEPPKTEPPKSITINDGTSTPPIDNSLTPEPPAPVTPASTVPAPSVPPDLDTPAETGAPNQVVTPTIVTPEQPTTAATPELPKHGGTPIAAVIVAIIIAVALAGLTVFAYLKSRNTTPTGSTTTQTQSPTTASKATPTDVDNASSSIDKTLSTLDDTNDFATAGLNDTTLGL